MKFQPDNLLLVVRQLADQPQHGLMLLGTFQRAAGPRIGRRQLFNLAFLKALHAPLLPQYIVRTIATDGEKPFGHMSVHLRGRLGQQPDKSVLHDIACPVGVTAEQAGGIAQQRRLMACHRRLHKGAGIKACMGFIRFVVHVTLLLRRMIAGFIRTWTQKFYARPLPCAEIPH